MIYAFFIIIHVIISIAMVMIILMQASKGKGLAGAFGGAGGMATQMLGARGTATFLSKATVYLAVIFMVNCILLSFFSGGVGTPRSAVQEALQGVTDQSPAGNLPLVPGSMDDLQSSKGAEQQPTPLELPDDGSGQ
jgi:preprotein translocase subunit SecG